MAKEDIVFSAKIDQASGAKSLSDLKKEFKDLQKELSTTQEGTDKYIQTLKKLGAVKDDMGDLRDTINAFNPEGKVQAFANVAGKLAGGFQAATGAAALFGAESEELQKTLLKVQAATAFAEGIQSLTALSDGFQVLGTVIKTNVVAALTTLKGAIIATGIGALAVAIGVLIYKTQEYNEAIEEEYDKQRKLNEELKKTTDEYLKQAIASENLRNTRKGGLNDLERELKLLEAQGASADKIAAKKQEILDKEIYNLKVRKATIEGDAVAEAELQQQILDKENEKQVLMLANEKRIREEAQKTRDEKKRLLDQQVKDEEAKYKAMLAAEEEFLRQEAERREAAKQIQFDEAKLTGEKVVEAEIKNVVDLGSINDAYRNVEAIKKKEARDKIRQGNIDDANFDLELAKASLTAANALSETFFSIRSASVKKGSEEETRLAKQQFNVRKAMMLALAAIDGGKAITASLAASPLAIGIAPNPIGIASLAAAITTTTAQIAKIASMKFESPNVNSGASTPNLSASSPNIQTSAPNVTSSSTRLGEDGRNLSVNVDFVETQATKTQQRVKRLQDQSTFP